MIKYRTWIAAVIMTVSVAAPSLVFAQDTGALLDRIERLERDIRTLNVQIARGGGTAAVATGDPAGAAPENQPAYARLNLRVSQMETDLRSVTGRIEEMSFTLTQIRDQLDKMATDMDFRLRQLEQGGSTAISSGAPPQTQQTAGFAQPGAPAPASPQPTTVGTPPGLPAGSQVLGTITEAEAAAAPTPEQPLSEEDALLAQLTGEVPDIGAAPGTAQVDTPAAAPAPSPTAVPSPAGVNVGAPTQATPSQQTAALPQGTPREKYMYAFGLLRQGQYDVAADALRQFLEQHNNDALAANARYWLGETYYVRGAYVEAAETFLEGFQADPQGSKAPDALLKLGMSLASLEKTQEACAAFQKLRVDYPAAPAGLKSTLQREWQKNGCV